MDQLGLLLSPLSGGCCGILINFYFYNPVAWHWIWWTMLSTKKKFNSYTRQKAVFVALAFAFVSPLALKLITEDPQSHSLWFISPTFFTFKPKWTPLRIIAAQSFCFKLVTVHVYVCVCICGLCDVSCRSASTLTPEWESGGPRPWQHSSRLASPTNTTLHWPKIRWLKLESKRGKKM